MTAKAEAWVHTFGQNLKSRTTKNRSGRTNFFPAACQNSGPAAESTPFGGLTRRGALALARCVC